MSDLHVKGLMSLANSQQGPEAANSHVSELGSKSAPIEPQDDCTLASTMIAVCDRLGLSQRQLSLAQFLTYGNSWIINVCCFKPLSLG